MLILSRKPGDAILIDGGIRIVVLACDGGGVRIGIEAPLSVAIVREEIVKGIADENVRAGATSEHKKWLEGLGAHSPTPEDTERHSAPDSSAEADG